MFDTEHILKDAGAVTASGYGEVESAAKVADLGSGLVRGNVIIDVSEIALAGNDELYGFHLMGGDDESFTNEVSLVSLEIGANEVSQGNRDAKMGRYVLAFQNERNGIVYPYARIRHVLSGASPSVNYTAQLEKDLPQTGRIFTGTTTTTTT
jgi:hypothetical protein